jgi:hypothetical protein
MDTRAVTLLVIGLGVALVVIGVLVLVGGLSWFGRLPGDICYESNSTRVYIPITSMLLVSLVLSVAFAIARRFFT